MVGKIALHRRGAPLQITAQPYSHIQKFLAVTRREDTVVAMFPNMKGRIDFLVFRFPCRLQFFFCDGCFNLRPLF